MIWKQLILFLAYYENMMRKSPLLLKKKMTVVSVPFSSSYRNTGMTYSGQEEVTARRWNCEEVQV